MAKMHIAGTTEVDYTPESEQITVGNFSTEQNQELTESVDNSDYGNISIPGELLGEQPQEQSVQEENTEQAETTESIETAEAEPEEVSEENPEQTEAVSETESSEDEDDYVYELDDGSRYSIDDIESWRKDSLNRHEWSKSNTEKAQQLSDQRRAVEPLVQLIGKLKENTEFSSNVREAIVDEYGEEAGQLYDQSLSMNSQDLPNPYQDELHQSQDQVATLKAQIELDKYMYDLRSKFSLSDEEIDTVLDYAVNHSEQYGRLLSPEEAYKIMNFDKVQSKPVEAKPKPSVPVNVKKNIGMKGDAPKKVASYDDIDVASFFNQ
tara:strand:+ start:1745 stop:2710 length:966 start_codon:yes stop_codon:yes gene_type:complete